MLDRSIKATADDAMVAKLATTKAGYYVDPFLDAFAQSSADDSDAPMERTSRTGRGPMGGNRRRNVQPIIKRGTHARVCVMDRAISSFLKTTDESETPSACQVVILGAGKDTSYFRYRNGNLMGMVDEEEETKGTKPSGQPPRRVPRQKLMEANGTSQREVHWYEVDHVSVVTEKASVIRKSSLLKKFCPLLVKTENGYESGCGSGGFGSLSGGLGMSSAPSPAYRLIGHDLRESPSILLEKLNLNPSLPTLFVMECVSMYIPITESKNLLQALSVSSGEVYIACYEPILGSGDPFGRVMEQNLLKRGVASPECCLLQTRTLQGQLEKLVNCDGFIRAIGCNMWSAYETIVTAAQRKRANQSEFMDEYEEWILIMQHYCFVVAQGGRSSDQSQSSALMKVLDRPNIGVDSKKKSSSLGWVSGKCLQLQNH